MIHLQKVTAEADLAVCLMIRRRVFIDEQGVAEALEMDEYDEAGGLKNCPHYLALSDGVPVATCRCLRKDGGAVKLIDMNQIQALFSQLVAIIQSKTDTGNMIVENMTQMI